MLIKPGVIGIPQPGVPVTDAAGNVLPSAMIKWYVDQVMQYARANRNVTFKVSAEGWRYHRTVIAPMFDNCPDNVSLPYEFIF